MRELRLPFGLRFLRAIAVQDQIDGEWASSAPLFRWSGVASFFGLRGSEFLDTPHSRRRRKRRGLLAILCKDVSFFDTADRRLAWPMAQFSQLSIAEIREGFSTDNFHAAKLLALVKSAKEEGIDKE